MYEGRHWLVDHMYPVKLAGWLIVVTKRHTDYVHDLSVDELVEFGLVVKKASDVLMRAIKPERIYVALFAETPNFHLHAHVIPKPHDLGAQFKGPNIFKAFTTNDPNEGLPAEQIASLAVRLREEFLKI
jgi:diadenosine tetraphosphate (Ap4A) HIT family hydrolase